MYMQIGKEREICSKIVSERKSERKRGRERGRERGEERERERGRGECISLCKLNFLQQEQNKAQQQHIPRTPITKIK